MPSCAFERSSVTMMGRPTELGDMDPFSIGDGVPAGQEATIWVPAEPEAPATVITGNRIGLARIVLPAGEPCTQLLVREGLDRSDCCGSTTSIQGMTSGGVFAARIHAFDPARARLPQLQPRYAPRRASHGTRDFAANGVSVDQLFPFGTLLHEGKLWALLADVDGQPRGWEPLTSLPLPAATFWGSTTHPVMVRAQGNDRDTKGFAEPALEQLALRVADLKTAAAGVGLGGQ